MSSETIVYLIITVISVVVTGITTNSLTQYRIKQLENKVDKHNSLMERVYKIEQWKDDHCKGVG